MENGYGIFYLRDKDNHPKGAVGYGRVNGPGSDITGISITVCSVHDTFTKERARQIVFGRLRTGKFLAISDNDKDRVSLEILLHDYKMMRTAKRQGIDIPRMEYILKKILIGSKEKENKPPKPNGNTPAKIT